LAFFAAVCNEQASLVASWMTVGFIHGVMNTDNMAISGETIDYGPCAFMDAYDPATVFSSIDVNGRYAYGNQPAILTWNLTRLAETLIPLVNKDKDESIKLLTEVLQLIKPVYTNYWLSLMRSKIGLSKEEQNDIELITNLLEIMEEEKADFTNSFRLLSKALIGDTQSIRKLFNNSRRFDGWMMIWQERISQEGVAEEKIATSMNKINPIYIPRNHKVEEVLKAVVNENDMKPFSSLYSILQNPYKEIIGLESFSEPAPESNIPYKTFCGT
ncbi:protein adenylyltransferase SelO family protein, partial [Gammaproteobacteria bacterium]|nr:protein adenylyltransferase SelO family protein [Gammaproteobacteria bacterium]